MASGGAYFAGEALTRVWDDDPPGLVLLESLSRMPVTGAVTELAPDVDL